MIGFAPFLVEGRSFQASLYQEPKNLDPQLTTSSGSNYLFQNIHRNLLKFSNQKGILPDLAEKCFRPKKSQLVCTLKKDLRWSDGSLLTAQDFLNSYKMILQNASSSTLAGPFFSVKNAKFIFEGKKKIDELGIIAKDSRTLEFNFETADPEFEYNLTRTGWAPRSSDKNLKYSGPYQLSEWKKGVKITLKKNDFFPDAHKARPEVEFYFLVEDFTTLQFYEKGKLDFVRRLPNSLYPAWKDKKDFYSLEVLRFDYYGFNQAILDLSQRKSLLYSLDFDDLQKIYNSVGTPGCAALPADFFKNDRIPCVKQDTVLAKSEQKKVKSWPSLSFMYSTQGGDDPRRLAEWLQDQWKKNLGLKFKIDGAENKLFINKMKSSPPPVFRKGLTLDRPTCLAAVESFTKDNPENYLKISSEAYEKTVENLKNATSPKDKKRYCTEATQWLIDQALMIPSGRYDFFTLVRPELSGLEINWLNQMDLSQIHWK